MMAITKTKEELHTPQTLTDKLPSIYSHKVYFPFCSTPIPVKYQIFYANVFFFFSLTFSLGDETARKPLVVMSYRKEKIHELEKENTQRQECLVKM